MSLAAMSGRSSAAIASTKGNGAVAKSSGSGGVWELRLSGTSVQATVVDYKIQWSYGDEISSLRVGTRQVK